MAEKEKKTKKVVPEASEPKKRGRPSKRQPLALKEEAKKEPEKIAAEAVLESGGEETFPAETPEESAARQEKSERYFEGVGRRKTAIARARLFTKGERGAVMVNDRPFDAYFLMPQQRDVALASINKMKIADKFRIVVKTRGGGLNAQAEAIRLAIARSLVKFNPDFRKRLKRAGYLRRDPRMVERKKPGLKKARRAPQWAKR